MINIVACSASGCNQHQPNQTAVANISYNVDSRTSTYRMETSMDSWLRHRLRVIQLKHWKRGATILRELRTMGASVYVASQVAGTTKIGRYVLNHSFMIPGLVATAVSVATGLLIARMIF